MSEHSNRDANMPMEYFEVLAAEQRHNIHNTMSRARHSATETIKDRLDVKRNVREYFWPAAGVAAVVGLVFGYSTAGIFTNR